MWRHASRPPGSAATTRPCTDCWPTPRVGRVSLQRFARAYERAASIATLSAIRAGGPESLDGDRVALDVTATTRIFGPVKGRVELAVRERADGEPGIDWRPEHVFPGLRKGEKLTRDTRMPARATIQARDGTPIAKGEARLSDLGPLAVGDRRAASAPPPPEQKQALAVRGVPADADVGLTGLEREFDERLAGTPGGTLRAGERVLAQSAPRPGAPVRTTIDPEVQRAAVEALAGRYRRDRGAAPARRRGAGAGRHRLQRPAAAGLDVQDHHARGAARRGVVKPSAKFPVQTSTTLEGVELENANGEACGGSLRVSFAESCNSVFAPLGARLGAERLVAAAERFGFNEEPTLTGAARSTLPAAGEIGDDLAVGSTAIGQGKVLTTPLKMAEVAAAVAEGGVRPRPTLLKGAGATAGSATTRPDRPLHRPRDALGGHRRHGRRRRRARHQGGGQDRHRRAALDGQRGPHARARRAAARGGHHRHRRLVHGLRAAAPPARGGLRAAVGQGAGGDDRRARRQAGDRGGRLGLDGV